MKYLIAALTIFMAQSAFGQSSPDSLNQVIDSLFIQATTKNINYQDQVKPAQKKLAEIGEPAVPRLVERMNTQDARTMLALVDIFKMIGRPAVPYVVEALGADDPFKRRLAARALGEMKDSTAVEGLLHYTDDTDFRIRAGVVVALGKIGDSRGIDAAVKALGDEDYLVRTDAATALSMFKNPSTIEPLLTALSDPYYGVRYKAAEAIWDMGKPAVAPVISGLSSYDDPIKLYLLIEIAGNLKDKKLIKPLSEILKSDDPFARAFAVVALGKFDTKKTKSILRKLKDKETHPFVIGKLNQVDLD